MNNEKHYSIEEFSKRIGVSTSTLRNWDKSGLLSAHHRTSGGHRVYTETQALEYLSPKTVENGVKNLGVEYANGNIMRVHYSDFSKCELELLTRILYGIVKEN